MYIKEVVFVNGRLLCSKAFTKFRLAGKKPALQRIQDT